MESSRSGVRFGLGRESSLKPPEGRDEEREIEADMSFKNMATGSGTDDDVDGDPEIPNVIRLMYMAKDGNVDGIMDLLNSGTDVNFADIDGRTALHVAACQNFVDVVELLLKNGSKIDPVDIWGSTPLADAIHYKNNEVIKVLKKYGANIQLVPMLGFYEVPEYEIDSQELDFSDSVQITKGTFRSAYWRGIQVAVKTLGDDFLDDEDKVKAFRDELALLQKIRHPNVVQFLGAVTISSPMMIVTEYLPKGDLRDHLKKNGALKSATAVKFALDIARGMSYLHENKPEAIIHRDLEPSNILQDDSGHLKVADFGISKYLKLAKTVKEDEPLAGQDTSCRYVAPEVFLNKGYDTKVDVFSFSLILQEMFEGCPPFSSRTENDVRKSYAKKERPPFRASLKYPRGIKQAPAHRACAFTILISIQQDQLILIWLLSLILPTILASVTSCETAYQVWDSLQHVYSDFKLRFLSLKQRLQQISKGSRSVSEYIAEISKLVDCLAIVGGKTSESDKVLYTLSTLGEEYEAFVQSIIPREGNVSFVQLQTILGLGRLGDSSAAHGSTFTLVCKCSGRRKGVLE